MSKEAKASPPPKPAQPTRAELLAAIQSVGEQVQAVADSQAELQQKLNRVEALVLKK